MDDFLKRITPNTEKNLNVYDTRNCLTEHHRVVNKKITHNHYNNLLMETVITFSCMECVGNVKLVFNYEKKGI